MLLAACCFALAARTSQDQKANQVSTDRPTLLVVYQERHVDPSGAGVGGNQIHGTSLQYSRVGIVNWKVLDGGVGGVPCRLYTGDGEWEYKSSVKNTAMQAFHKASFDMKYDVGLNGTPIHSESHFSDVSDRDAKYIDVVADYRTDHVDVTITKDGNAEHRQIYPEFGMSRFSGMFEPMIIGGLVQHDEMDCAVIHPFTGLPYEFKLQVHGRFTGDYFFMRQEGYYIDVLGKEGNGTLYVTRQGQLLEDLLPHSFQATLEEGPAIDERQGWGHFSSQDWSKSTLDANPDRPTYHTVAVPVMFTHPKLLFPVPCAITD